MTLFLRLFVISFVIFEATTYASNDMIMPGMITVVSQFKASLSLVATSLSIFILGNSVVQLFLGPIAERCGKRIVLLWGVALFLIFTVFLAVSNNIWTFMIGRLLQGTGCAFVAIGYAIIHEKLDDVSSVKVIALMGIVTILAPLFGPLLGGLILTYFGWRDVFIVIGVVGLFSFIGLIKFMPYSKPSLSELKIKDVYKTYLNILNNKKFILGSGGLVLEICPLITWIGMSPTLIMKSAKLNLSHYISYQIVALLGLSISCIAMQFIAGKLSFHKILTYGNIICISGLLLCFVFAPMPILLAAGISIYGIGFGLIGGTSYRLIIDIKHGPASMIMSMLVFAQTIVMAAILEGANLICGQFNFSLRSFALINLIIGIIAFFFIKAFSNQIENKKWE